MREELPAPLPEPLMLELSFFNLVILLGLGVLIFGRDLPDVAKRVGQFVLDLRKTARNVADEFRGVTSPYTAPARATAPLPPPRPPRVSPLAPKFVDDETPA